MSIHYPRQVGIVGTLRPDRERISNRLSSNPQVTEDEAREIPAFVRTRRHLDAGLSSNDRLPPNLESFTEDRRSHFQLKWRDDAAVIGGVLVLLVTTWLIWAALAEAVSALALTA